MRKKYRKYLVWFIMASVFMVSLLQRFAAGVLQKNLTAEFSSSPSWSSFGFHEAINSPFFMTLRASAELERFL